MKEQRCPCPITVGEARTRLREALYKAPMRLHAEIDHTRNAFDELISMHPSVLFLFDIPTPAGRLLRSVPELGLFLPLRIHRWQDAQKQNWISDYAIRDSLPVNAAPDTEALAMLEKAQRELIDLLCH